MADVMADEIHALLDADLREHPYRKFTGSHWRLVELADLAAHGARIPEGPLGAMLDAEFGWLLGDGHTRGIRVVDGLTRRCASQEGNALYAASLLGRADDDRAAGLARRLTGWQWEDGGWNCDRRAGITRSSFHESATPALGLAAYSAATGDAAALKAAHRTAELLLSSRMLFSRRTGELVHPSFAVPHYPAYWHYDLLQGLRLLAAVRRLDDQRASDAVSMLAAARREDARFGGPRWSSSRQRSAIERGRGTSNRMLTLLADEVLAQAGAG